MDRIQLETITEWADFVQICNQCQACNLAENRTNAVVWRGSLSAPLVLIGEGPGEQEDLSGIPFVGRSGQLLDRCLDEAGITDGMFHIMNMVKCRPPGNRKPTAAECAACRPLLEWQLRYVKPNIIVLLGASAYNHFTGDKTAISKVRGQWLEKDGYLLMPTFHPAYVLRDPRQKDKLIHDLMLVRTRLEDFLSGFSEHNSEHNNDQSI